MTEKEPWHKNKTHRNKAGVILIMTVLSVAIIFAEIRFYKSYQDQVIQMEESQLLTIAEIIGNNLDSFLSIQLKQLDLLYTEDDGSEEPLTKQQLRSRTEHFLSENESLYNWAYAATSDREIMSFYFNETTAAEIPVIDFEAEPYMEYAQIAGKKISSDTGWYELYIKKDVPMEQGICRIVFAMNLETLYEQTVAPVKIGKGGYSTVKDQDMCIIMHHAKDQIGLEAYEGRAEKYPELDLTSLNTWILRQTQEDSGSGILDTYIWDDPDHTQVRRVVAFQSISIQGERWIINSTLPITELSDPLNSMMELLTGGMILYMLILILFIVFLLQNHFHTVSQEKEIAYLKEINQGMEILAKKNNELRHYQRIQSLGMMSSHIAHEFNNYLTPVLIYAELLEEDPSISEENQLMIHEITGAIDKAANLSRELLAFSRQDTGIRLELLNFTEEVKNAEAVVECLAPAAIVVQTDVVSEDLFILGRRGMAEHILMNLCKNAFQAMEKTESKILTISLKKGKNDTLMLQVADTGCGISEENLSKIFEPFYTTKGSRQGTGLGLSVVQNMVTSVGGTIHVESHLGAGTIFSLEIPCYNSDDEKNLRKRLKNISKIAIVSGDENLKQWKSTIRLKKRTVDFYEHPAALIDRLQKNPNAYEMVIADNALPTLTGIELCEIARRIQPEMRLILIAEQNGADFEWYVNNGIIDRFLVKSEFFTAFAELVE